MIAFYHFLIQIQTWRQTEKKKVKDQRGYKKKYKNEDRKIREKSLTLVSSSSMTSVSVFTKESLYKQNIDHSEEIEITQMLVQKSAKIWKKKREWRIYACFLDAKNLVMRSGKINILFSYSFFWMLSSSWMPY